jgi:hypothetical protein
MQNTKSFKSTKSKQPSITAVAVAIGTIVLLITYSLPGGLSGGEGFILGTGVSITILLLLAALSSQKTIHVNKNNEDRELDITCPRCRQKITINIDFLSTKFNNRSNDY